MNFILLFLYIIIIFAWFIDTLHILLQLEGKVKVKKTSRETNENMHSNSARAKFVNRISCFMRKYPRKNVNNNKIIIINLIKSDGVRSHVDGLETKRMIR